MKRASVLVMSLVAALCLSVALCGCSLGGYEPEKKSQSLPDSSLVKAGTLTVGVDTSSAPFAGEANGTIAGIDVDVAAALADEMGLSLELVNVGSDVEKSLADGTVDIVMGVEDEGDGYKLTKTYRTSGVALFSANAAASAPTSSTTIAAQSSSMSAMQVTKLFGDESLVDAADLAAAFESLSSGSVEYVAADSTIGAYVAHTAGVSAYPVALLQDATSFGIAVPSTKAELFSAVKDALASITDGGMVSVIDSKWVGAQPDIASLAKAKATVSDSDDDDDDDDEDEDDD